MALQDLTPQLRTRLNRVERTVGVFVIFATLLLIVGLSYYLYHTAKRKGWFVQKANYFTMLNDATGLHEGDQVMLMGFPAGEITSIMPNDPGDPLYNVTVTFQVRKPYYGYIWSDSYVKVQASLLGTRYLEMIKGGISLKEKEKKDNKDDDKPKPVFATYKDAGDSKDSSHVLKVLVTWDPIQKKATNAYVPIAEYPDRDKGFWLVGYEAPPLAEQASKLITMVESALPNFLALTNQVNASLSNSANLLVSLNETVQSVRPVVTNMAIISTHLSNPQGSLGEWLIPTQINQQLQGTLATASNTVYTAETNLVLVVSNLNRSLDSVAGITANLRQQVQANSLMLSEISSLVINADDFLQGLKRNWLLKGAFNAPTNPLPQSILKPGVGGRP